MLSNNLFETPRPRPPAQARRAISLKSKNTNTPPPPYHQSSSTNVPSMVSSLSSSRNPLATEGPHDELSQMFVKADELIKEREHELAVTTKVCKALYENNLALKNKHQALLARLPGSPLISPLPSPPLVSTVQSHYFASALASPPGSPPSPSARLRRNRQLSVSPSDLALLSDQKAELFHKLETLEAESERADLAGRTRLRKLEREIQGLRNELEDTRMKVEEEAKTAAARAQEARTRDEREHRLKAERERLGGSSDGASCEDVRDFAPANPLSPSKSNSTSSRRRSRHSTNQVNEPQTLNTFNFPSSELPSIDSPMSPLQTESALVSQLLLKICELETANQQITAQQRSTNTQLQSVQQDAESITRVYESLDDDDTGLEWELAPEEPGSPSPSPPSLLPPPIRFGSWRRTLNAKPKQSTMENEDFLMRKDVSPEGLKRKGVAPPKSRASVVGLFSHIQSPSLSSLGPSSPISLALPEEASMVSRGHSLESELGGVSGRAWDESAASHHLRTTSLFDLTVALPSTPPSPAPTLPGTFPAESPPPPLAPQSPELNNPTTQQILRYRRMSQTIRSRTSQWVDGRFRGSMLAISDNIAGSREDEPELEGKTPVPNNSALPERLANVFEAVLDTYADADAPPSSEETKTVRLYTTPSKDLDSITEEKQPAGLGSVLLEVWLWLQFAIIVMVFLWAMARKGPKSVLGEAERRQSLGRA